MPKISVIIPAFNAERYISETIESVLNQTMKDFELIIVNDASTDKTLSIISAYAAKDSRVILVDKGKIGYSAALNIAISLAKGEFLARLDADDVAMSDRLSLQVKRLEGDPGCVAVGGHAIGMDDNGRLLFPIRVALGSTEIESSLLGMQPRARQAAIHPALMIRAKSLHQIGGYRPEFEPAEDRDLLLRLSEIGRLENVDSCAIKYRLHTKSVSFTRAKQQHDNARRAIEEARARRNIPLSKINIWNLEEKLDSANGRAAAWALSAARSGFYSSAITYGFRALWSNPANKIAWRALAIAAVGFAFNRTRVEEAWLSRARTET